MVGGGNVDKMKLVVYGDGGMRNTRNKGRSLPK